MICYAMQQCKVNFGRLITESLTRSATPSHQDVTLTLPFGDTIELLETWHKLAFVLYH